MIYCMFSYQLFKLDYEMYATGDHFRDPVVNNYCYLIAGFTLSGNYWIIIISVYNIHWGESAISLTYWLLVCSKGCSNSSKSKTNNMMHVVF